MKILYLYVTKRQIKIFPQVQTKEGFNIMYKPVVIIDIPVDSKLLSEALFSTFEESDKVVDLGDFPAGEGVYSDYVEDLLKELKEKSLNSFQKKSREFIIEMTNDQTIMIYPLIYKPTGSIINNETVVTINTSNKNRIKIAQEILGVIGVSSIN